MVVKLGMSEKVGMIGFPNTEYVRKPYSEDVENKIDEEIKRLNE